MTIKSKSFWISLSILDLCIGTFLAAILRSKTLFELPSIDYNLLLHVHSHFALGWVTLALMVLMVNAFLTEEQKKLAIYQFIFWGIFACTWGLLLTFLFPGYPTLSTHISILFIFFTYVFSWVFIRDIRKATVSKTTQMLSIVSVVCLALSSAGTFSLSYLFAIQSLDGILYRDALYSYLHLQYNGFFTLAVFALLFQKLEFILLQEAKKNIYHFSLLLVISILPSMFLSYRWHDTSILFYVISVIGSILVMICFVWFITVLRSMLKVVKSVPPLLRFIGALSIGSFMLKTFLQSFTIFSVIGNFVFGDRPIIMGFLHLVFLGFVALFLLLYVTQTGLLNIEKKVTKIALVVFAIGVVVNEALLWSQGIPIVFIQSGDLITWLLLGVSIWIFIGALLIGIARIKSEPRLMKAIGNKKN